MESRNKLLALSRRSSEKVATKLGVASDRFAVQGNGPGMEIWFVQSSGREFKVCAIGADMMLRECDISVPYELPSLASDVPWAPIWDLVVESS